MILQLCLACSSSLPSKVLESQQLHLTPCCGRSICQACLESNPRLARYNPCLSCLGGVGAVSARTNRMPIGNARQAWDSNPAKDAADNLDGGVRDSDLFVLGDDDDDAAEGQSTTECMNGSEPQMIGNGMSRTRVSVHLLDTNERGSSNQLPTVDAVADPSSLNPTPGKYHIKKGDTLYGIALKHGVDARLICRMNNLPTSTLSTTPNILHTRTFLTLPPSLTAPLPPTPQQLEATEERERAEHRRREQAEKRFQCLTKEVDWRVARAYILLADDPESAEAYASKRKELGGSAASNVEARAVDDYFDDEEWEAYERSRRRHAHSQQIRGSSSKGFAVSSGLVGLLWGQSSKPE